MHEQQMLDKIRSLQEQANILEPAIDEFGAWNRQVFEYASEFLASMDSSKSYEIRDESAVLDDCPIRETGKDLSELLDVLKTGLDTSGINPASGGHIGFIPGGGILPAALGDYLAAVTNRYAGIYFGNPGAVRMENILIRWMADLFGYDKRAHGNLASGGSIANLIGITTARDAMGVTPENIRKGVIYLHEQTHHCVDKAIRIAGLEHCQTRHISLDDRYRMDPAALEEQIERDKSDGLWPFLLVASLGSTDTGAVDPVNQIADIAEQHDLWLHIDAAYGGFFILVDAMKHLFTGIHRADSLVIDPHKGLFLPYGLGAVIVKDVNALRKSHYYTANYMQDAVAQQELSPAELSPELTKHFRGLRMWLPMQMFGLAAFRAALEEKWMLARYFHERIRAEGFETGPEPELSVVIYRYNPPGIEANAFNKALVEHLHRDGRIFVSSTSIRGEVWLRLAILSFRTHLRHVDTLVEMLCEGRDTLLASAVNASQER